MTQRDRLLRALGRGPVAATAFSLPDVIDGGLPIFRVAARVGELRDAGYAITTSRASNGVAVYQLVRDASDGVGDRHAPLGGGPTDPADTSGSDWEAAAGHLLPTQPTPSSEQDRPAAPRVDTPGAPPPPGCVGQLFSETIVEHTTRPHWMETA